RTRQRTRHHKQNDQPPHGTGPTERAESRHWSRFCSSWLSTLEPSAAAASAEPGQRLYWYLRGGPALATGAPLPLVMPKFSAREMKPRPMAPRASKPPPVVEKSSSQPRKSVE